MIKKTTDSSSGDGELFPGSVAVLPEKVRAPLFVIAILYVTLAVLVTVGSLFDAALSRWDGGVGVTKILSYESLLGAILVVLAVVEAYGLFRRLSWARAFGIVWGILFTIPGFIQVYGGTHVAALPSY